MEYRVLNREPRVGDMVRVVKVEEENRKYFKVGDIGVIEQIDDDIMPYLVNFKKYTTDFVRSGFWYVFPYEIEVIEPIESTSKEEKSKVKNQRTYTTPEIIATLKVGQRATNTDHGTITKDKYGGIVRSNGEYLHLNPYIMKAEWTIVPEYVDFMTAFRAWKDGKRVECFEGIHEIYDHTDKWFKADHIDSNKWIILDDGE
jgi:hypothetical protein